MFGLQRGAFPLFRVAGVGVYLHWTWLLMAYVVIKILPDKYDRPVWKLVEFLAVFAVVLLHEFGHALACRSVGGEADTIVLWPLGGVAFVRPPQRPGAVLWSIAAGPLVNVFLVPVTGGLALLYYLLQAGEGKPSDVGYFLYSLAFINLITLAFNLLPIYPLDGGQIFRALLWFFTDRETSLLVVSVVGLLGGAGLAGIAVLAALAIGEPFFLWFVILGAFLAVQSWAGLNHAQAMLAMKRAPRNGGHACPSCAARPPEGVFWTCGHCGTPFDLFGNRGACPECDEYFEAIYCPECHEPADIDDWARAGRPPTSAREGGKT
jgi:Zn-dependent protease